MVRAQRGAGQPRPPLPKGFWPIWSTVALDLVGFGIVVPILALYAERYGASGFTIGMLFTVFSVAQFVVSPLLGRLSDRIGRRPVIIISLLGTAAGSFISGAAGALWVLFVGRAVDGASGASMAVAQAAVTDLAPPDQRPRLLGLLGSAFGLGFVAGPAIGGLAALGGPRVPFFVAGGLALVNAVAAWVRVPETNRAVGDDAEQVAPSAALGGRDRRRQALNPTLRRLAAIGLGTSIAFTAFESTFTLFGERRFDLTERGASVIFLGIGVLLVIVQAGVFGRIAERMSPRRSFLAGLSILVVGLFVLSGSTSWAVLAIALVAVTIGQGIGQPSMTSWVAEHAPARQRGEAMGYQQSANAVGRIIGPPFAGLLFDHVGVWSPYVVGGVLCAAMIAVATTADRDVAKVATG